MIDRMLGWDPSLAIDLPAIDAQAAQLDTSARSAASARTIQDLLDFLAPWRSRAS